MMSSIPHALASIEQQPQVQEYFAAALAGDKLSHAYLFVGPAGSGKMAAARALAQCVVCPAGGDGSCDECTRVMHDTHPDVRVFSPASAQGYLISQVRDLIAEASLAPVRATSKVYILTDVGQLRQAAANALLKTIEEPPKGVMFILLAHSVAQVLPTIASRCQQVPFRVVSADAATAEICSRTGAAPEEARIALGVAGTTEEAVAFISSVERRQVRSLAAGALGSLAQGDDWDALVAARHVVEAVRAPLDEVKRVQAEAEEENAEYLSAAALRQLKDANKREIAARERSGMMEALAAVSSLLRDVLMRLTGVEQDLVNVDMAPTIERLAAAANPDGILGALGAVSSAADDLARNVSPQLAFEVMLIRIKEALTCPPSSR